MKRTNLFLWLLLAALPIPLALLFGLFVDYSDPANRGLLYLHPGYYHHSYHRTSIVGTGCGFRGGGPRFGK